MRWIDFIFSDRSQWWRRRHMTFWIAWSVYFSSSYFFLRTGLLSNFDSVKVMDMTIKCLSIMVCHIVMTYVAIYVVLPISARGGHWLLVVIFIIGIVVFALIWSYDCYSILFPWLDGQLRVPEPAARGTLLWNSIVAGFLSGLKVITTAIVIRLLKISIVRQTENERLRKEKIALELDLLKAQVHPDVLFSSLRSLSEYAQSDPGRASELVLKLSDLLDYVLYQCDDANVLLEKEITMLQDYFDLQKIQQGALLDISMLVRGDTRGKKIAPLILMALAENIAPARSFDSAGMNKVQIDITVAGLELVIKTVFDRVSSDVTRSRIREPGLENLRERLALLYPSRNEFIVHQEPHKAAATLKLILDSSDEPVFNLIHTHAN